mgnify:CR=1 FL=1
MDITSICVEYVKVLVLNHAFVVYFSFYKRSPTKKSAETESILYFGLVSAQVNVLNVILQVYTCIGYARHCSTCNSKEPTH